MWHCYKCISIFTWFGRARITVKSLAGADSSLSLFSNTYSVTSTCSALRRDKSQKQHPKYLFVILLLERNSTRQRWADEQSLFHLLLSCIQSAVFEGNESSTWGCPGLLVLRVMWANFSYCVLDINLGSTSLRHSGAVVSKHINVRLTGARQSA